MPRWPFVLAALTLSVPAHADPLVTDRPGNGNAASTVGAGRFQIEGGVAWTQSSGVHQMAFPLAARWGVVERVELRLWSGLLGLTFGDVDLAAAWSDTAVGTKVSILANDGAVPDLAVMADVYLPTGGEGFTTGTVAPEARVALAWALPAGFGLFGNLGGDLSSDANGRFARFLYLGQVNYTIEVEGEKDPAIGLFVEAYGRSSFAGRADFMTLDYGVTWRLNDDLQLDLWSQHRVVGSQPPIAIGLGISARI